VASNQYVNKVIFGNDTIIDISNDTVVASALLSGYTAHANSGASISGSILTKTSNDLSVNGDTVTVPAGYYSTQVTKSVSSLTLPTSISSSATSGYTLKATVNRSTSD